MPMVCQGPPASKPPTSRHAAPSGGLGASGGDAMNEDPASAMVPASEADSAATLSDGSMQRFTSVLVGVSSWEGRRNDSKDGFLNGGAVGSGSIFWDVHISGPHAHWAWRALLGSGASGPTFASFSRNTAPGKAVAANGMAWPVPVPACLIATSASHSGGPGSPSGAEFAGHSWLFNGPQAANARGMFIPQGTFREAIAGGGFASCCAALCGKRPPPLAPPADDVVSGLEEDGDVEGLASCADFEASMLARSWRLAPQLLEEALAAGVEAWALCSVSLARVAHDMAAAAAGARGRALPLLVAINTDGVGAPSKAAGGAPAPDTKAVALVPEGPLPLLLGSAGEVGAATNGHACGSQLGALRLTEGVQAWLRVCRPVALWSAAGGTRGFAEMPLGGEVPAAEGAAGVLVVEALQAAFAVPFSERMVNEVWVALAELEASKATAAGRRSKSGDAPVHRPRLMRRACGTWAQVAGDDGSLLL